MDIGPQKAKGAPSEIIISGEANDTTIFKNINKTIRWIIQLSDVHITDTNSHIRRIIEQVGKAMEIAVRRIASNMPLDNSPWMKPIGIEKIISARNLVPGDQSLTAVNSEEILVVVTGDVMDSNKIASTCDISLLSNLFKVLQDFNVLFIPGNHDQQLVDGKSTSFLQILHDHGQFQKHVMLNNLEPAVVDYNNLRVIYVSELNIDGEIQFPSLPPPKNTKDDVTVLSVGISHYSQNKRLDTFFSKTTDFTLLGDVHQSHVRTIQGSQNSTYKEYSFSQCGSLAPLDFYNTGSNGFVVYDLSRCEKGQALTTHTNRILCSAPTPVIFLTLKFEKNRDANQLNLFHNLSRPESGFSCAKNEKLGLRFYSMEYLVKWTKEHYGSSLISKIHIRYLLDRANPPSFFTFNESESESNPIKNSVERLSSYKKKLKDLFQTSWSALSSDQIDDTITPEVTITISDYIAKAKPKEDVKNLIVDNEDGDADTTTQATASVEPTIRSDRIKLLNDTLQRELADLRIQFNVVKKANAKYKYSTPDNQTDSLGVNTVPFGVNFSLDSFHISNLKNVRDFDLDFFNSGDKEEATQLISIVGSNGAGKTTIYESLLGMFSLTPFSEASLRPVSAGSTERPIQVHLEYTCDGSGKVSITRWLPGVNKTKKKQSETVSLSKAKRISTKSLLTVGGLSVSASQKALTDQLQKDFHGSLDYVCKMNFLSTSQKHWGHTLWFTTMKKTTLYEAMQCLLNRSYQKSIMDDLTTARKDYFISDREKKFMQGSIHEAESLLDLQTAALANLKGWILPDIRSYFNLRRFDEGFELLCNDSALENLSFNSFDGKGFRDDFKANYAHWSGLDAFHCTIENYKAKRHTLSEWERKWGNQQQKRVAAAAEEEDDSNNAVACSKPSSTAGKKNNEDTPIVISREQFEKANLLLTPQQQDPPQILWLSQDGGGLCESPMDLVTHFKEKINYETLSSHFSVLKHYIPALPFSILGETNKGGRNEPFPSLDFIDERLKILELVLVSPLIENTIQFIEKTEKRYLEIETELEEWQRGEEKARNEIIRAKENINSLHRELESLQANLEASSSASSSERGTNGASPLVLYHPCSVKCNEHCKMSPSETEAAILKKKEFLQERKQNFEVTKRALLSEIESTTIEMERQKEHITKLQNQMKHICNGIWGPNSGPFNIRPSVFIRDKWLPGLDRLKQDLANVRAQRLSLIQWCDLEMIEQRRKEVKDASLSIAYNIMLEYTPEKTHEAKAYELSKTREGLDKLRQKYDSVMTWENQIDSIETRLKEIHRSMLDNELTRLMFWLNDGEKNLLEGNKHFDYTISHDDMTLELSYCQGYDETLVEKNRQLPMGEMSNGESFIFELLIRLFCIEKGSIPPFLCVDEYVSILDEVLFDSLIQWIRSHSNVQLLLNFQNKGTTHYRRSDRVIDLDSEV